MIHIHEEAARCLLCENVPCTKAYKKGVGCHLCRLVCPTGATGLAKRIDKVK